MARILVTAFGSYGDVHPALGLALALRGRGHEPVLALPAYYRADVEALGLELRPVRPDLDLGDGAVVGRVMARWSGPHYLFTRVIGPAVRDSYRDLDHAARDVDLVVTHPALPAGPVAAGARGLPWVSVVLAPTSLFSAADPVVPPPLPAAFALTSRSSTLSRLIVRAADRASWRWARPVLELRRELGLDADANPYMAGQHSPLGVLALFSRLLADRQADWPARTRVTGAVLFNGRAGTPPLPPELGRFLDAGDPPVVFTLGSSAVLAPGRFFAEAVAAAGRIGRRAVLLAGRDAGSMTGPGRGDRWLAVGWADHAALFPRAAAVVHQAGAGTLHQALAAGRPQLVVPHAFDQPDNAMRAVRLGVATKVEPRRFRARRVARALDRLLSDTGVAGRAEAAAAAVRAEPGAAAACDVIEDVLASPSG